MGLSSLLIHSGILNAATQVPSPNFNKRHQLDVSLLVIHSISLPPGKYGNQFIDDLFCNRLDCSLDPYFEQLKDAQVSAHLLIRRDGTFTQYVNFLDRAWHAGQSLFEGRENCNDFSIGIELEGLEGEPFEELQYQSLAKVSDLLMVSFPNINKQRIVGHSDIAPGRKMDPGAGFDWNYYFSLLDSIAESSN